MSCVDRYSTTRLWPLYTEGAHLRFATPDRIFEQPLFSTCAWSGREKTKRNLNSMSDLCLVGFLIISNWEQSPQRLPSREEKQRQNCTHLMRERISRWKLNRKPGKAGKAGKAWKT